MSRRSLLTATSGIILILFMLAVLTDTWARAQAPTQRDPSGEAANDDRRLRFTPDGTLDPEIPSALRSTAEIRATEAPAAFDGLTNGFNVQGPAFDRINEDTVVALRSFNDNRFIFEEVETVRDGLGPTYNAQSCRECHQNVVTGGASQVTEHRTGRMQNGQFFESLGGSLIQSRATHPEIAERVAFQDDIRTFRISTNTLGNGFVEAISNTTLLAIRDAQPLSMRGTALTVPVLEANGAGRLGRFGWKNQHASLESFSADAYLNEMGITTPIFPDENSSSGNDVRRYDTVADPEDDGIDVVAFANFMRSTKAPSRGPITATVTSGEGYFRQVGCATCHVATIRTAPLNTVRQRRKAHRPGGACGQAHSSVQRFSPARRRHRRRDPGVANRRVCIDRIADAHGSVVGIAYTQPADARRAVVYQRRRDTPARRAGVACQVSLRCVVRRAENGPSGFSRFVMTSDVSFSRLRILLKNSGLIPRYDAT